MFNVFGRCSCLCSCYNTKDRAAPNLYRILLSDIFETQTSYDGQVSGMLRFTSIQEIILFDGGFIFVVGKQVYTYVSGLHRLICNGGIDAVDFRHVQRLSYSGLRRLLSSICDWA